MAFVSLRRRARPARPRNHVVRALTIDHLEDRVLLSVSQSVARQWDDELLDAIRVDTPRPPVHARNLFHTSIAMYDAWAAYDQTAVGYLTQEKASAVDVEAARNEAISYAAYRILTTRFANSVGKAVTLPSLDAKLAELGYDKNNTTVIGNTPAALGNRIAATVLAYGLSDGSLESLNYLDPVYKPVNPPMVFKLPGTTMSDPNSWQPLAFDHLVLQNGIVVGAATQTFVGPHWGVVKPFALEKDSPDDVLPLDPGPPPRLGSDTDALFKAEAVDIIRYASMLDPADPTTIDISPGAMWNNPLGTNDGTGYPVNPYTGLPYEPNVVNRADMGRVLAEFWADGPHSETPPGHWNVLANYVGDHALFEKRIAGTGPIVDDLEWDVKVYLALNGATHDAAVAAWGVKGYYDSARPISMIRYMGGLGQSSDPSGPSYHPDGLPLVPDLVEVITAETTAPGERHEHLAGHEGEIAIRSWRGQPENPATEVGGVGWIRAVEWITYQRNTFVTPPFAGYVSGHSTFSRSAAEVLTHFTGSPYFPGGLGTFTAQQNEYLTFEEGPTTDIVLQWATYYDAADQAGISRLWGSIHVAADDFQGRIMGAQIGDQAFARAMQYFTGQVALAAPDAPQVGDIAFQLHASSQLAFGAALTAVDTGTIALEPQSGITNLAGVLGSLHAGISGSNIDFVGGSALAPVAAAGSFSPASAAAQAAWQLPTAQGGIAAFAGSLRGASLDLQTGTTIVRDAGGNFSLNSSSVSFAPGSLFEFEQSGQLGQIDLASLGPVANLATAPGTLQLVSGRWHLILPIDVTLQLDDIDSAGSDLTLHIAGSVVALAPVVWTNVTETAGLDFVQSEGPSPINPPYFQPNMTGGAAVGDYNRDGYPDLFVTRLDAPPILYRNRGDGTFQDVTQELGLHFRQPTGSNGAGWADVDNDGDLDLYVTSTAGPRFYLYINRGAEGFTEEAVARGAALAGTDALYGQSVTFGDYDNDGWLDLHVTEWRVDDAVQSPSGSASHTRLLRNRGGLAPGQFIDVTAVAGVAFDDVAGSQEPGTYAMSSKLADFDGDGWLDLAIVGDHGETRLFWNNGDGTFSDGTATALPTIPPRAIGSAIGDFNGDGMLDWFVTGVFETSAGWDGNRLYLNNGNRTFLDATADAGLADTGYATNVEALDYDHDGDLDLVVAGGSDFESFPVFTDGSLQLWRNNGSGVFENVTATSGLAAQGHARGLVTIDFDRDGDRDLLIVNHGAPSTLYRNDGGSTIDWLRVELVGDLSNPRGIGATIDVTPVSGGPTYTRHVTSGGGFLSQSDPEVLFGLGSTTGPIAQVRILWPSGIVQTLTNVARNKTLRATEPYQGPTFSNVTAAAGINYLQSTVLSPIEAELQFAYTGGAAAGDFDRDGWVDLFVTRYDAAPILYRNLGNGSFADVTATTGLDLVQPTRSNGAGWADLDNDGDLDLYVTSIDDSRFYLYMNDGAGHFSEEAIPRGAAVAGSDRHFGQSVSFGDYDRDGFLDIYVAEWRSDEQNPTNAPSNNRLLRNQGTAAPGHFVDVTVSAGVSIDGLVLPTSAPGTWGFTPRFADLDHDGWLDLALVADFNESRLYWNNGDGTFRDATVASRVGTDKLGMGSTIADFNGDGLLDWFVTSIADATLRNEWHHLYLNADQRLFHEAPPTAGINGAGWGWGTSAFDYDNDGDQDIVLTAGVHNSANEPAWVTDPMRLLRNDGTGFFHDQAQPAGMTNNEMGKGLLTFDYDRDGDLDVFVVNHAGQPVLYRNNNATGRSWLRVETTGTLSNRDGIGARVTVTPMANGPSYVAEVSASSNFLAQNESALHFGLNDFSGAIHDVTIEWPSGVVQHFTNVLSNSTLVAVESGTPAVPPTVDAGGPYAVVEGQTRTLTATSTGNVSVYEWDLDDNGTYETVGQSVTFVSQTIGTQLVRLRVRGPEGSATAITTVDVQPLEVDAGGPYTMIEGGTITLQATVVAGTISTFEWDLDDNGSYETTGQFPLLTVGDDGVRTVRLRATGPAGVVFDTATVSIQNAAPSVQIVVVPSALIGSTVDVQFQASDPSPDDAAAGFTYQIDWTGDGFFEDTVPGSTELVVPRTLIAAGPVQLRARAVDKDGAVSAVATWTIQVNLAVLQPNVTNPALNDLAFIGTDGDDQVAFRQLDPTTIEVRIGRWNGVPMTLIDVYSGVTGGVVADGRAGDDNLDAQQLTTISATLEGGLHDDVLTGGSAADVLRGDPVDLHGDGVEGNDVISGGGGNDTIFGDGSEGSADTLYGGEGDDSIVADGADGQEGHDVVYGDAGHDRIQYGGGNNLVDGGSGNDLIWAGLDGAEGMNQLDGGSGDDVLVGAGGVDQILGRGGRDIIIGGNANDVIDGGANQDLVIGGATAFDNNEAALLALRAEWISAAAYSTRIAHLTGQQAGGLNGAFLLAPGSSVFDDDAIDVVFGGSDLDWFWYHSPDDILSDYSSATETRTAY